MKKQIYLVLGLLFLVLIQGCEKSSEQFSCDEQVHDWTVKNLAVLENMNRAELATLPFAYQRAALRAFAPEKKYEIWNEKLDIVLAQQWDDDELLLIQELEKNLIPDFFSQSNMQQTHLYLNDWANRMFQETNMDSITFVLSFMHICTFEEIELLLYPPQNESISGEDGSGGQRVPDPPALFIVRIVIVLGIYHVILLVWEPVIMKIAMLHLPVANYLVCINANTDVQGKIQTNKISII